MKIRTYAATLGLLLALIGFANAQIFPDRTLTMVIPFAAGGPTDVLGRVMAQRMGEILGQTVIVENIGGAGGMNGGKKVADSKPDGYTMLLGTVGTQAQGQTLYKHPLYNALTDFTPVALIADVPIVLIVRKDLPVNNFKDFVTYAKANASKMQFGSAGAGSATHLGCVVLNTAMGTDIVHVPYKGTGPAMQDLIGGRIDYLCEIISTAKPQIDGGQMRGIRDGADERDAQVARLHVRLHRERPRRVLQREHAAELAERPVEGDEVDHLRAGAHMGQAELRPVAIHGEAQHVTVEAEHPRFVADPQHDVIEACDGDRVGHSPEDRRRRARGEGRRGGSPAARRREARGRAAAPPR